MELLDATRLGTGGLLVIRGEAGAGKTTLLEFARERAAGMQVLRATGIAAESEIAFAGLLELVRPALRYLDALPQARADALRTALGLGTGVDLDRFAAGAATLDLLAAAAEDAPLLVVVDDAQWLDETSIETLLFAAHRLSDDPVAVILAERDGESRRLEATGGSVLALAGLDREATARLAESTVGAALSPTEADRLYRLTRGNPLAVDGVRQARSGRRARRLADRDLPHARGRVRAARLAALGGGARGAAGGRRGRVGRGRDRPSRC